MLKRVAILLICLLMVFIATFSFIVGVVSVPTIYSYAETSNSDLYTPLRSQSDLVTGFQAYCKSRDLTIDGSVADAVTTFTTGAFNGACNTLGINITQLQAEIKAEYDQSGKPVKFLFNSTGVMAMNRIFAQFLQDNQLQVGDENVEKTLYSGMIFTDNDGVNSLVTFYDANNSNTVTAMGTPYHGYDGWYAVNDAVYPDDVQYPTYIFSGFNFNYVDNNTHTFYVQRRAVSEDVYRYRGVIDYLSNSYFWMYDSGNTGMFSVLYNIRTEQYYIGSVNLSTNKVVGTKLGITPNTGQSKDATVIIVSPTINNNNYEGDTIINNNGDVIVEPDPVQPGGSDPGWDIGGGDGTATDGNGNTWNIKFPDFELPDLNIDWQIHGLGDKFPFSIPFDLVALVTVLNAEPEAPRFEGTVDFGFTTWDYDINLEQFDAVASACRIAEILLLVFGLILITRSIIKG